MLCLVQMDAILEVDPRNLTLRAQCGAITIKVDEAAAVHGLFYPPDPGSIKISTIGGNVAENSGGVHCLKYGLTLHNVLKVRGFTIGGEPVEFGSAVIATHEPDDFVRLSSGLSHVRIFAI